MVHDKEIVENTALLNQWVSLTCSFLAHSLLAHYPYPISQTLPAGQNMISELISVELPRKVHWESISAELPEKW